MPYHRTEAIILRKTDYSNTSMVFSVFTREMGRLGLIAKGIKRGGAAHESEPELFSINDVVFSLRREGTLGILTESAVMDDMRGIGKKVERFWAACYLAELLLDLAPEFQPLPEVYDAAAATLRALAGTERVAPHVFSFELALLRLLGHEPRVAACAECGAPRGRLREIAFSALKGGCLCDKCGQSDPNAITIRGSTAALMEALGKRRPSAAGPRTGAVRTGRVEISGETAKDLRRALDYFFTFLRERPSKTLKYMQALYK
jgi:DNA repair protein RecO (recombination protein O)